MATHGSVMIQKGFEESLIVSQFLFALLFFYRNCFTPSVRGDRHILERVGATELPEDVERSNGYTSDSDIRNAMKVYDPVKRDAASISVVHNSSLIDLKSICIACLLVCKKVRNKLQYMNFASVGIIKSRRVDELDFMTIKLELGGHLNILSAGT
jgi:hypothetical protein